MNRVGTADTFSPMLKTIASNFLAAGARRAIRQAVNQADEWRTVLHLARLRRRMYSTPPGANATGRVLHYTVRMNNGPSFYILYKDIFIKRIYHFEAQRADPLILDCGSNIGMSILYFKHVYPKARLIGFEPDPAIFPYLQENIACNRLEGVKLVKAAVVGREGMLDFYSDGRGGSCLAEHLPVGVSKGLQKYEVPCVRLRSYLTEPVDFLKMNIESAEYEVLKDSADRLRMIREMVLEYHHHPGLPRTLHKILALLHEQGFEYLINDFDSETNAAVCTPFRLMPETYYWLLIYARRLD